MNARNESVLQPPPSHKTKRWSDPLRLIQEDAPSEVGRIVLWVVSGLVALLIIWAYFGKLDIIATADGKLVPQTLVKVVQPAEAGVVKEILVREGDAVIAGQLLARLDATLANADRTGIANDLKLQRMQERRLSAELKGTQMQPHPGDIVMLFDQVKAQHQAHVTAYRESVAQEQATLAKLQHEQQGALDMQRKLEQTLPTYSKIAAAYAKLEQEGFMGNLAAADKQREATEKAHDLAAQRAAVEALHSGLQSQRSKIAQMESAYRSDLEKELADVRARIAQLQPNLDKTVYRSGLMELRAPQNGTIKDLSTTTVGAVVQPGAVIMTLIPRDEQLFADVSVKNEDVGFVRVGQRAQIKLATYPFQQYGMVLGEVIHLSLDASEVSGNNKSTLSASGTLNAQMPPGGETPSTTYKARIRLQAQTLRSPASETLLLSPGMQVVAEIHQGRRTVLEYLLDPVHKAVAEAGHER